MMLTPPARRRMTERNCCSTSSASLTRWKSALAICVLPLSRDTSGRFTPLQGLPQKKPFAGSGVPLITHQPFDHAEMVAKDVRDVGVRFTEANDDLEQFADRAAGAAGGSRQAQRAQPSATDENNRLKRQNTFPLAFAFALGDLGEQVFQLGGAEIDPARRG